MLVFGCGPIGLLTIYAAARKGAHVTAIDPVAARLEIAKKLGAAAVETDASKLPPAAANVAIDAAGFEATWRAAIDAVENGGSIVMVGLGNAEATFPMALLVRRSIRLRGQFAYSRAEFQEAIDILQDSFHPRARRRAVPGRTDLERRILRHTSEAFVEDPLRVLRGMQFAGRFNLTGAPEIGRAHV